MRGVEPVRTAWAFGPAVLAPTRFAPAPERVTESLLAALGDAVGSGPEVRAQAAASASSVAAKLACAAGCRCTLCEHDRAVDSQAGVLTSTRPAAKAMAGASLQASAAAAAAAALAAVPDEPEDTDEELVVPDLAAFAAECEALAAAGQEPARPGTGRALREPVLLPPLAVPGRAMVDLPVSNAMRAEPVPPLVKWGREVDCKALVRASIAKSHAEAEDAIESARLQLQGIDADREALSRALAVLLRQRQAFADWLTADAFAAPR